MKNKVLVISGAQETGKSFLIERIIGKEETLYISGRDKKVMRNPFLFNDFRQGDTRYVVLDSVDHFEMLEWFVYAVSTGYLAVHRQGHESYTAGTSGVLFIVETSLTIEQIKKHKPTSFLRRMDIIELASCSMKQEKAQPAPEAAPVRFASGGYLTPPVIPFSSWYSQEKAHHYSDAIDAFAIRFYNKMYDNPGHIARQFALWADNFLDSRGHLNSYFPLEKGYQDYLFHFPGSRETVRSFKHKLRAYVEKKGWVFNPKPLINGPGIIVKWVNQAKYSRWNNMWIETEGKKVAKEVLYVQTTADLPETNN